MTAKETEEQTLWEDEDYNTRQRAGVPSAGHNGTIHTSLYTGASFHDNTWGYHIIIEFNTSDGPIIAAL